MKRAYSKHEYSGHKTNSRSRAAMKRCYGEEKSHPSAWRTNKPKGSCVESNPMVGEEGNSTGLNPKGTNRRTYAKKTVKEVRGEKPTHDEVPLTEKDIVWPQDLEVQDHKLTVEKTGVSSLERLHGYRIVDIKYLLKWSMKMQAEHNKHCTCGHLEFVQEERTGLSSTFQFKCNTCDEMYVGKTESVEKINKSFVWGTLTGGSYYTQSGNLLAAMDIPSISQKQYAKIEINLGKVWEEHLVIEMLEAGKKEKEIAIQKGHICTDGVPYITVCVDGGWSKRSYGHNFNANSGIACIIGKETKKCLFLGIKNKYCSMCERNQKRETNTEHICFKNYEGSSTGMESIILQEGFCKSIEMHGVRYRYFIGDGDSSVFSRLKENVPYARIIEKLECKNHVIKIYTSDLYKTLAEKRLPIEGRKLLNGKIKKLTIVARLNIIHNVGNVEKLRTDLKNGVSHVFGEHTACASYYCKWKKAEDEGEIIENDINNLQALKQHAAVWGLIQAAIDKIIKKADRLTGNETNNLAENFMSLMAKFNCGKRINLTKGGSYQRRGHIAGLYQVSGHSWVSKAWKTATMCSPGIHFKKYLAQKSRSAENRKKIIRRRLFTSKPAQKPDKDYGPKADDPPPDIPDAELQRLCEEKLQELQIETIDIIERQTVGQHGNANYDAYRKDRLTASNFGMVCKRRKTTLCHNQVKTVLYKSNFSNNDTRYGQKYEIMAIKLFEKDYQKSVLPAGLFIDAEYGFLGASPDGIVQGENAIVEVKCFPSVVRLSKTLEEVAQTKKNFSLTFDKSRLEVNKKHNYYYQIQGQLRVAQRDRCYLICFVDVGTPIKVIIIEKDDEFIGTMIPKLVDFYRRCVLPEIILRRVPANQKCLEPK